MVEEIQPVHDSTLVIRKPSNNLKEAKMNIFTKIAPFILAAGNELVNFDEDSLGGDDFAGELLIFIGESGLAIEAGGDISPELPEILQKGTTDKLSKKAKFILRLTSTFVSIGQTQVPATSNFYKLLKYAGQAIRALIADQPVPPAPSFE